ncbi:hypothetical protein Taro_024341 [Colocasia esculenta]|uniref:Uncharacterized protein n=1 Tax=Colocasia esculenta TaxID=4460 RepID=A0A843V940_COLES|nr:hypothetical protein [Colocasia esculenta]
MILELRQLYLTTSIYLYVKALYKAKRTVWELTANNIIMVSAIGNDGPLYGTLNNPADQSDVIGVGGIDYDNHIASFSSRGMSTWEIPHGYGRVKPDVVAYGRDIMGSKISTGCKSLSGTSVASPVVAGAVCLLVSVIPESIRKEVLNPAIMKQALVEAASKLSGPNMYEQGAGRLDLLKSYEILKNYQPRASIFPSVLDYTDCPYSWPFCRQPLYASAMPVIFNATILNGMGVTGFVEGPPTWQPFDEVGNLLSIRFTYSDVIWPWTGFLALHMQIKEEGTHFAGIIEGNVTVKVSSPPHGEKDLEDEYFVEEIEKLRDDVINGGLGLAVFAEWYNVDSMVKMRFFDDNTRSWWTPVTGGANIPAINELLAPFGIALGDKILNGDFSINGEQSHYASGTDIIKFPASGYVHSFQFQDSSESGAAQNVLQISGMTKVDYSILGLLEVGGGRITVYGDSNCLDSSHMVTNCYWLLRKILDFTNRNTRDPVLFSDSAKRDLPLRVDDSLLPSRRTDVNFSAYSAVIGEELICGRDTRFEVWGTKGYRLQLMGRNRKLPGYPTVDLVTDLNGTVGTSNPRWDGLQKKVEGNVPNTPVRNNLSKSMDFLGLLNRDEVKPC